MGEVHPLPRRPLRPVRQVRAAWLAGGPVAGRDVIVSFVTRWPEHICARRLAVARWHHYRHVGRGRYEYSGHPCRRVHRATMAMLYPPMGPGLFGPGLAAAWFGAVGAVALWAPETARVDAFGLVTVWLATLCAGWALGWVFRAWSEALDVAEVPPDVELLAWEDTDG